MANTPKTKDRKKPVRRTAVETCSGFRRQLLKAQVLCMDQDEDELGAACEDAAALISSALRSRRTAAGAGYGYGSGSGDGSGHGA